jgi:hypothetical protein
MHVIWKRPDGYHGASPSDYKAVQLKNHSSRIWLHKTEHHWFPFRVSGGWQDENLTKRLNLMVNLLDKENEIWNKSLSEIFDHSSAKDENAFIEETVQWLSELKGALKGDKWEIEIMEAVLTEIESKISDLKSAFVTNTDA